MRYFEIIFEDNDTESVAPAPDKRIYYHVTTKPRVKSIKKNGLEPGHHRRWRNAFGKLLGQRDSIYLISDYTNAIRWASYMEYEQFGGKRPDPSPFVILKVKASPSDLLLDPHPQNGFAYSNSWFMKKGDIPPEDIVEVIPLTPLLRRQVVNGGTAVMENSMSHGFSQRKCVKALVAQGWYEYDAPGCFYHEEFPEFRVEIDPDNKAGHIVVFHNGERVDATDDPDLAAHGHLKHGTLQPDPWDFSRRGKLPE